PSCTTVLTFNDGTECYSPVPARDSRAGIDDRGLLIVSIRLLDCRYADLLPETLHIFTLKNACAQAQCIGGTTGYSEYERRKERIGMGESYRKRTHSPFLDGFVQARDEARDKCIAAANA